MNKAIEIYKIVFLKTNFLIPSKEIEQKVFLFENKKRYESFWKLHTKKQKELVRICGFKLKYSSGALFWEKDKEFPIVKNIEIKIKKKKDYSFDFINSEETKAILDNIFSKDKNESE